jgi:hypothetical protein
VFVEVVERVVEVAACLLFMARAVEAAVKAAVKAVAKAVKVVEKTAAVVNLLNLLLSVRVVRAVSVSVLAVTGLGGKVVMDYVRRSVMHLVLIHIQRGHRVVVSVIVRERERGRRRMIVVCAGSVRSV